MTNNNLIETTAIEAALLEEHSVNECVVQMRHTDNAEQQIIAFVVSNSPFVPERLQSHLQAKLPTELLPSAYVPLSALPLTADGQLDQVALARVPVIDTDLVEHWEQRIQSLPEINQVAVVVQEKNERLSSLPLSNLLPDWKTANDSSMRAQSKPKVTQPVSASKKQALSYGGQLQREIDAPTRLSDILERAALKSEKGIIYIQSDGSEQFQSYQNLLEDAQRILEGLRKRGLKPQDKVIFQIEPGQDFIPAFWGCILGGFIPVPISIAPTYQQVNNVVNKLHNAWQMLEQPLVLTNSGLAQNVRSLSTLLNLKDFKVETVDNLRNNEPLHNIYNSQPNDLTLLLLTSGSTGMPKAVMLNHRNLLSMSAGTVQMNDFSSQDVTLNWMPLDHVGAIVFLGLMAVDLGCQQIHVPTDLILKNPLKWLELIERHRVSISWAPNFAFSLLNERADEINQRQWDLSSMGFLVNAGEQIVAKTARNFLKLLQAHGLPSHALRPAFGMSETCSGITWSKGFSLENSSDEMSFVELGAPIPGASLRIVDENNQIVTEGTIGRFQVKGPSVTEGYYQNPERNREVFSDDGWFNTGDIGYLQDGHLILTGRDKDDIIINGINFYSHEIEAVVEEIEPIEISYTAACAVLMPGDNSDKLAIFFVSPIEDQDFLKALIKQIRGRVVQKVGVNPNYLIPVTKEAIPKTAIGKIQRSQLTQRFEAGEFDPILQQFGIETPNSLPDWFYRQIWRRKLPATLMPSPRSGQFLIFLDSIGLGKSISHELTQPIVFVEMGTDFLKLDSHHYQIVPDQLEHYQRLLAALAADDFRIEHILHLWTYEKNIKNFTQLNELKTGMAYGVDSLLCLVQALSRTNSEQAQSLLVVSNYAQCLSPDEKIAYEKAPMLGLIKTISQEMSGLDCRHIDFGADAQIQEHADHILQELRVFKAEPEVAYRNGQRWIARLEKTPLLEIEPQTLPFKKGGMYLISGGLGGIGVEIAKYLLTHYQARLLLIGRTHIAKTQRIKAYQTLEQMGGEILYQAVDVCELERLQQVVTQAKSKWHSELDGIIHLAGIYHEHTLMEETHESFAAILRPKVLGTWTLHQLIKNQPDSLFINFSSVNSFFGGAAVGAFAAASRFLNSFSHYQKSYCFDWSLWDEIGMNRHSRMKDSLRAHGYYPITTKQGLSSFLIGLRYKQPQLLIGLDGSNPHIRRYLETHSIEVQKLTAYFTTADNDFSKSKLPAEIPDRFQTPTHCHFVQLPKMPLTETGEIDKNQLVHGSDKAKEPAVPTTEIEQQVAKIWQDVLGLPAVGLHDNFFELGGHSVLLIQAQSQLQEQFGVQLSIVDMFTYPTIETLANYLNQSQSSEKTTAAQQGYERAQLRTHQATVDDSDIAVIGMACRFPGANNIEAFWQNLKNGVESIDFFTAEEVMASGVAPDLVKNPNYVKANPILTDIESFDAAFFGYSAREAEWMDPQQRLLLECAWESLEDAGYNPITYEGLIGVYAGAAMNTYLLNNIYPNRHQLDSNDDLAVATLDSMGGFQMMVANDKDYLTTRISYKLNLRGPSVNVQTACSTSLLAIHNAVQSLQTGECDMALAGGVSVQVPQKIGHLYQEGMIVSPDGHCRAFDAQAQGTIFGSGAGIVVLKRLKQAVRDGDQIYAVIKGSAANNDGGMKVGYMAPSGDGQAGVASEAIAMAGITADTVTYVETHGTGTVMGDPIEVGGLTQAFQMTTDKKGFCAIGSVKTNVGHLQIASGIVGFIKTVLALHHQQIPPSLHFETPNPSIDFANSPFYVNTQLTDWKTNEIPRRAGVNSLGIGGTNIHVILEEAPKQTSEVLKTSEVLTRPQHLLTLSAKSETALHELVQRYEQFLLNNPKTSLADICLTANTGRVHFEHRLAVVADSIQQLRQNLSDISVSSKPANDNRLNIAFLFTGQGAQYVGMGRQLYETQPTFRQTLARCDEILHDYLEQPLLDVLYSSPDNKLDETAYTQPALFALEYALAELWQSWGIKPTYVMGHSVGEYVAACVAGVFSLEDGLKLIAERARLMYNLPRDGEMVTVFADETRVATAIQPYIQQVSIAAVNGPESLVISGQRESINAIITTLEAEDIKTKALKVSHAFHSPLMESMLSDFDAVVRQITFSPPQIQLISNLTGELATADITTPEYWCHHIRQPVRFATSMATLYQQGCDVFVEIGPKPVLLGMGRQCLPENVGVWLPSLRQGQDDWQQILQSLGELYVRGATIDWAGFDRDYQRRRVALPTYPFQRRRYWVEKAKSLSQEQQVETSIINLIRQGDTEQLTQLLTKAGNLPADKLQLLPELLEILVKQHQQQLKLNTIKEWFYQLTWLPKPHQADASKAPQSDAMSSWLIFADQGGIGQTLAQLLQQRDQTGLLVYAGNAYSQSNNTWSVNPANPTDFDQLFQQMPEINRLSLKGIIHLWSLDASLSDELTVTTLEYAQSLGSGSVLHLVQTLLKTHLSPMSLYLVTKNAAVPGQVNIAQSPLWGLGKVIALEHPEIWGGMIDLASVGDDAATTLLTEILAPDTEDMMAYRDGQRYVARLVPNRLTNSSAISLATEASYLITGGLGVLGLRVAQWLAAQGARHLILTSRSQPSKQAQETINQLQQDGVEVLVANADVASESEISTVFASIVDTMPPLQGIVHAAGVVEYEPIKDITFNSLQAMLRPKVQGAWILHQQTQKMPLDFFVCFSSIASVWGSKGQAHYAAANHFLDMLAHYRHGLGLPALTINWGPWADGGMASAQSWLNRQGVETLPPQSAIEALSYLLGTKVCQSTVAHVNWSLFKEIYAARQQRPLLEQIQAPQRQTGVEAPSVQQPSDILQRLKNASKNDGYELLTTYLQEQVTQLLGLEFSEWPTLQQGFFEMGMDSLMAVELKNRLVASLGTSLPATLVFDYPNIQDIAKYLGNQVLGGSDEVALSKEENKVISEIEQLPDDELEVSIAQRLARLKTLVK
jgi:malonyl CoA-acyl carrier protein transacylase